MMTGTTLFERIWRPHVVADLPGDRAVVVIDRLMVHEITGGYALRDLVARGARPVIAAERICAVAEHAISTAPGRGPHDSASPGGREMIEQLERSAQALGIPYIRPDSPAHGIVHVIAPERGFVRPGETLVCGDSHTCTLGAFGALAFAVGASEIGTVLAHNALILQRPRTMRLTLTGRLHETVSSKDVALAILGRFGSSLARGHVIEFAGPVVDAFGVEERLTLCNMAAEMGTRYALIAPDETLAAHIRRHTDLEPAALERHLAAWLRLRSDADAVFDRELRLDVSDLAPQVTWGTSPMHARAIGDAVPDPQTFSGGESAAAQAALGYMGLVPGTRLESIAIDAAFIGSCTNARLGDLRAAASVLRGRKVAPGVHAMCTPGSMAVRMAAEAEGIDRIFREAGFEWRMPGCSNCGGREGPIWAGKRVVSSTNRNFENRQGPRVRTHLASPATVAASAIAGHLCDPRRLVHAPGGTSA